MQYHKFFRSRKITETKKKSFLKIFVMQSFIFVPILTIGQKERRKDAL